MYFIAGILLIGIILLGVDQWITPIFQRSPGAPGYIPIPGTDLSQVYWKDLTQVANITVGAVAPPAAGQIVPLSVTVLQAQTSYSLTMDVFIDNEYPQNLPTGQTLRVFFTMAASPTGNGLQVSLDNSTNTVNITCFDSAGSQQSLFIDNVPIHTSFRIGLTISPNVMEGYLNGLLVKTKNLSSIPVPPAVGHKIFATSNIQYTPTATTANPSPPPITLSTGISLKRGGRTDAKINAGEIGAKLTNQIELLPSCSINNKVVENNATNLNFGTVDFGETSTGFNGVIDASLMNNGNSGLQIQCAGISTVKIIFGSGNNDSKVPASFSQNYYHALSNGRDFVAYNLLYGLDRQVIRANDAFILNDWYSHVEYVSINLKNNIY
jgi:spore coat protein U-like protein